MPVSTLSNQVELDLEVRRGNSFSLPLILWECDDEVRTRLDLTGYTVSAQIRDQPGGRLVSGMSVLVVDLDQGEVTLQMSVAQTTALRPGRYVWFLTATGAVPASDTSTLAYGELVALDVGQDESDLPEACP